MSFVKVFLCWIFTRNVNGKWRNKEKLVMKETFHFQSFATSTFTQTLFLGRRVISPKKVCLESSIIFILEYCINYCIWCLTCDISVFPNPICSKGKNYRVAKSNQKVSCFLFHIKIRSGSWSKIFMEEFKRVSFSVNTAQIYWDTIFTYTWT